MRNWVVSAALIAALGVSGVAGAIDNVKILIPANPGGGWDQTGRALAQAMLAAKLVKNVKLDNRGGAGGTIGIAQFVNSAKGDPEALMIGGQVMVGAIELNKSPVTLAQVTPLARITAEFDAIAVPTASKFRTLRELLQALKADPGAVAFGGGSAGGIDHILVALMARAVGADPKRINYIPYAGGGEAMAALIGGHVAAGASGVAEFAPQVKAGKLRMLAVSSARRLEDYPTIPTVREQGADVEATNWRAVFAAPGITPAQRDELLRLVFATVKSAPWQETLKRNDWAEYLMAGEEFRSFLETEQKRTAQVLKEVGLAK